MNCQLMLNHSCLRTLHWRHYVMLGLLSFSSSSSCTVPLTSTRPLALTLVLSIVNLQPKHSELPYTGFMTSLATTVISSELLCVGHDICALIVFNFCHLRFPLCIAMHNVFQWVRMCFAKRITSMDSIMGSSFWEFSSENRFLSQNGNVTSWI